MRGRLAFGIGTGALAWSLGLLLAAFFLPAYEGERCDASPVAAPVCARLPSQTLFAANGWWVIELLLGVTAVAALALWALHVRCSSGSGVASTVAACCIVALAVFSVMTGLSIGLFVLPVALLLLASAALTPSP